MHFRLLQLYRNYRNIESLSASMDNGELMVFGHFDRISMTNMQTADLALHELYKIVDTSKKDKKIYADIQPIILFSENDEQSIDTDKCVVVSFMQINKPKNIVSTKEFYEYVNKEVINKINEIKQADSDLEDVDSQIYVPLSFMNVAVIFTSNNFLHICTLLKNIVNSRLVDFQYSVLAMSSMNDELNTKNISLSLRFIWNNETSQREAIESLHKFVKNQCSIESYHITHLMGNNDCLVTILNDGYKVLKHVMNVKDHSEHSLLKYVKNMRATIRFNDNDVKIVDCNNNKKYDLTDSSLKEVYSVEELCTLLSSVKNSPKLIEMAVVDLSYKIRDFWKFMNIAREHAKNKIALPLYNTFIDSYNSFIRTSEMWVHKCDDDNIINVFDVINATIDDMSSYYGNILHCHLGFFEERGFYNTIIGVASSIEIAYNSYANEICKAMLCDNERSVHKLKANCYVVSDKSTLVCATDPFRFDGRKNDIDNMIISINIPAPYLFEFTASSYFIIHEIAHFIGCKRREDRAQAVYNVVKLTLLSVIGEYIKRFYIGKYLPEDAMLLLNDFYNDNNFIRIYDSTMAQLENYIDNAICSYVVYKTNSDTTIYMPLLYKNLDNIMREIVSNRDFLNELSNIIADFHEKCVIYFDDLYANNFNKYNDVGSVIKSFNNMRIREFNIQIIKRSLHKFFIKMCGDATINTLSDNNEIGIFDKVDDHSIMLPDLENLLYMVCEAAQEAYSDLMMVYVSGMDFNEYYEFMSKWNVSGTQILEHHDYMSWMRISFVAGCLGNDTGIIIDGKLDFEKYRDIGIIDEMIKYFKKLIPDFELAKDNASHSLKSYFDILRQKDENEKFRAIFGLYLDKYNEVHDEN